MQSVNVWRTSLPWVLPSESLRPASVKMSVVSHLSDQSSLLCRSSPCLKLRTSPTYTPAGFPPPAVGAHEDVHAGAFDAVSRVERRVAGQARVREAYRPAAPRLLTRRGQTIACAVHEEQLDRAAVGHHCPSSDTQGRGRVIRARMRRLHALIKPPCHMPPHPPWRGGMAFIGAGVSCLLGLVGDL